MNKLLSLISVLFASFLFAQNITGAWYGSLDIQGQKLPLVFNISEKDGMFTTTLDSPLQGAKGIPMEHTEVKGQILNIKDSKLGMTYTGTFNGNGIQGAFSQNGMKLLLNLSKTDSTPAPKRPQTPQPPYPYDTQEISFQNEHEGNLLAGTLNIPAATAVGMEASAADAEPKELLLDEPFLFVAYETSTLAPLVLGWIGDPSQTR